MGQSGALAARVPLYRGGSWLTDYETAQFWIMKRRLLEESIDPGRFPVLDEWCIWR